MLTLLQKFFQHTVYVRIQPDCMSVRHVESGREYHDVPVLAIEQKKSGGGMIAVGRAALTRLGQANVVLVNGFKHPRSLLADFTVAEQTLKYFLQQVLPRRWITPSPDLIIHPQAMLDGGLTEIEIRAFAELGFGAGARQVFVWTGPELAKEELLAQRFGRTDGRLLHPPSEGASNA